MQVITTPYIFVARGPQKSSLGDRQNRIHILTLYLILLAIYYLPHGVIVEFLSDYAYKKLMKCLSANAQYMIFIFIIIITACLLSYLIITYGKCYELENISLLYL